MEGSKLSLEFPSRGGGGGGGGGSGGHFFQPRISHGGIKAQPGKGSKGGDHFIAWERAFSFQFSKGRTERLKKF